MVTSFELEKGRVFISGLHWQALSGTPNEVKREAQQIAEQLSYDLAVFRTTGSPQVGLAAQAEGYKPGMLSAAAVVSKTLEVELNIRDFLCATRLPDGQFLYVAQADGVIPPEGDQIGSEDEIRGRLLEDISLGRTWEHIIAPTLWGIEGSNEREFVDLLPQRGGKPYYKHSWWALKPLKQNAAGYVKVLAPFVASAVVVAGGIVGYEKYQQYQMAKLSAEQAAAAAAANAPPTLPHPWKSIPPSSKLAVACLEKFDRLDVLWPGNWEPETVVCNPDALTVTWTKKEHGWVAHLLEIVPKASVTGDGTKATLVVPMTVEAIQDEPLVNESQRLMTMRVAAEAYGFPLSVTAPEAAPPLPGSAKAEGPQPTWKEMSWSVKGTLLSPSAVVKAFDGAGLRINTLTARFNKSLITWDLEGTQYVLP